MAAIRARFIVVEKFVQGGVAEINLRATKQKDAANAENTALFTDNEASHSVMKLRVSDALTNKLFHKGREVFVDINGPI